MEKNIKIIIIDDDIEMKTRPLYVKLCQKYSPENVVWIENPETGLNYVAKNLDNITIVIIDYHFGEKATNGMKLFLALQQKSSLIYIILNTAKSIDEIPSEEVKLFINNHLMAIVDKTDGYEKALAEVSKGINSISNRIDCVLEEWIVRHEKFKKETPHIKDSNGIVYSLRDILDEIRKDTELGKKIVKNIISTAITILHNEMN